MGNTVNLNNSFSSENENIERFACFPWSGIYTRRNSKENGEKNRNHTISSSNNNLLLGICFITDMDGYFKYIHPNFLNLFEGVENKFFESSVLDKEETSLGSPSILKYLVAMIQKSTPHSFLRNRFSKCMNKFNKLQWNMVYNGGLLYFSLAEVPISPIEEESTINAENSPAQIFSKDIKKIYWKIEHAKMFHMNQISNSKIITE